MPRPVHRLPDASAAAPYPGFAARLTHAVDMLPDGPRVRHGRLTWLKNALTERCGISVSLETVRRWASGETLPPHDRAEALASLLSVPAGWLVYGDARPEGAGRTKGSALVGARRAEGATLAAAGALSLAGEAVAFPEAAAVPPGVPAGQYLLVIAGRSLRGILAVPGRPVRGGHRYDVAGAGAADQVLGVVLAEETTTALGIADITAEAKAAEAAGQTSVDLRAGASGSGNVQETGRAPREGKAST